MRNRFECLPSRAANPHVLTMFFPQCNLNTVMARQGEGLGTPPEELSDNDLHEMIHEVAVKYTKAKDEQTKDSFMAQWRELTSIQLKRMTANNVPCPDSPNYADDGYTYHVLRLVRPQLEQAAIEVDSWGPEKFKSTVTPEGGKKLGS